MNTPGAAEARPTPSWQELTDAVNDTSSPLPAAGLARLFADAMDTAAAAAAADSEERIAAVSAQGELSYPQLAAAVADLAGRLLAAGVTPGGRVILCADLGWEQLAGALAVWSVGGVVVPVPPGLSQITRWDVAAAVKAVAVVSQWWQIGRIAWPDGLSVLTVETPETPPAAFAPADVDPDTAALLLPDGAGGRVAVTHRALAAAVLDAGTRLGLGPQDRVLVTGQADTPLSLHQLLGAALAGATAVFGQDIDQNDPRACAEQLRDDAVSVWLTTPSLLGLVLDYLAASAEPFPAGVRAVVASGERLGSESVRELRAAASGELTIAHATSPAPGQPWAAWHEADDVEDGRASVPLGRPMANQKVYILSETLAPCPLWVVGRIHFGGLAAVPAADADAPAPVVAAPSGESLVATTLFGRLLPEGVVEVTGDETAQVTVHGRALRLQDLEVALAAHPDVRQAAAVPVATGAEAASESAAFVRVQSSATVTAAELLEYLRRKVSPYLLPETIELLEALPLSPDGRVDRAALAAAARETAAVETAEADAPVQSADDEELTRRVTEIACRQFAVSHIEPHVNMLDIGATSYQLVRLATVLEEELGLVVSVEEILRFPSIAVIVGSHLSAVEQGAAPAAARPDSAQEPESAAATVSESESVPEPATADSAAPVEVLTDLVARQAFKDTHRGIRHDLDDSPAVAWPAASPESAAVRRSVRTFDDRPVDLAAVRTLISATRMAVRDGEPSFRYPSAGGAYPVQLYILVAPSRVRDLPGGTYYYHPERDCLVLLDAQGTLPASAHADINRAAFRESAFSLFLIGRMEAIVPLYGELSWDFTVFEAGALTQLLSQTAVEQGLGLCSVGTMDVSVLPELFGLAEGDRFLHTMVGGVPADDAR